MTNWISWSRLFQRASIALIGLFLGIPIPSSFGKQPDGIFNAMQQHDLREEALKNQDSTNANRQPAQLQLQGVLICNSTPCLNPQLKSEPDGKVFQLAPPEKAANLYQSGIKKVTIQGSQLPDGILQIKAIDRL